MRFKLNENSKSLCESTWYEVLPKNNSAKYYARLPNDMNLAQRYLTDLFTNWRWDRNESVNKDLLGKIRDAKVMANGFTIRPVTDEFDAMDNDNAILTLTDSDFRHFIRAELSRGTDENFTDVRTAVTALRGGDSKQPIYIHHIDGREYNNAKDNLIIFVYPDTEKGKKTVHMIHKIIHTLFPTDNLVQSRIRCSIPFTVFDAASKNFIIKHFEIHIK